MDTQISDVNSNPCASIEHKEMLAELREQNYDVIRFATYRTACKLRFIQRKTNLYLVDIWNIIEASRENGLNTLDHNIEVNVSRLELLLSSIFYQLNKRLPSTQQIKVDISISLLLNWLLSAYDRDNTGKIQVFSIKVALATLCAGKLMDKFRYVFSQISDSNGLLIMNKCEDYLKEVLALPTAVHEEPSFGYSDGLGRTVFNGRNKITVNDFLDTLMSEPGPQCMMWLPVLHRMASVENVYHPIHCDGCHRESFTGFRYKCQRCTNYHLCQDCFWRGRTSGSHNNHHEMKEYTVYKSPAKQLSHSIRKSFRCVPNHPTNGVPHFPETPEKTLDLSHIVYPVRIPPEKFFRCQHCQPYYYYFLKPPTPTPIHNGFHEASLNHSFDLSSIDSRSATKSPSKLNSSLDCSRVDDEHRLIARYAARLAVNANSAARSPSELSLNVDASKEQRELIAQLEAKNREIMREIQRLRKEQEMSFHSPSQQNPTLLAELRALRQRKDELEMRMTALQESRRELMVQLEGLMKLLKNHQASPRSTPNSSPRSGSTKSPPIPPPPVARSTPTTPADSLSGVGGDVKQAFCQSATTRSLRNDLLVAADSVTNAMSSLVKELNSEDSGDDDDEDGDHRTARDSRDLETEDTESNVESIDGGNLTWREEVQKQLAQENEFMAELQARKLATSQHKRSHYNSDSKTDVFEQNDEFLRGDNDSYITTDDAESYIRTDDESCIRTDDEDHDIYEKECYIKARHTRHFYLRYGVTDDESYVRTDDDESYIKTDDDEGGNTDWEEAMKRWVNR